MTLARVVFFACVFARSACLKSVFSLNKCYISFGGIIVANGGGGGVRAREAKSL
jgi:hypothetical protein